MQGTPTPGLAQNEEVLQPPPSSYLGGDLQLLAHGTYDGFDALQGFLAVTSCGGATSVASPECTPAFSTCPAMTMAATTAPQATASM